MDTFDPYAELGVDLDATTEDIRTAFRRAAKAAHPDGGGNAEKFGRVACAEMILTDPAKRKQYDDTGRIDEDKPDNARVLALQQIEQFIEGKVQEYINGNFAPALDPRRADLLAEFREKMNGEIGTISVALIQMDKAKAFIADMGKRFAGKDPADPIGRGFERRLRRMDEMVAQAKESLETRRLAADIAASYSFKFDAPTASSYAQATGAGWMPAFMGRS